ncbi:hypothetical protein ACFYP4_12995 [Streptomyces sp. NPDC005551]|uniref:hypothetical protein n=1 Tax=Streptomyces sp. NPDC005551 TaxID=3364725 RepID=UPI0036A7EEC1
MLRHSGGRPADPRRVRLFVLLGAVAAVIVLPLAVASAGPAGDGGPAGVPGPGDGRAAPGSDDGRAAAPEPTRSPLRLGVGLATAARCGPELSSPDGVEAQTCVLTQGRETWARAYYRNATGDELNAALTLLAPAGRTVRMHCAVDGGDEPGVCETPRGLTAGETAAYTAVAEFARSAGRGPLLLRSGSNSTQP